jgi:DNA modification methylase
MESAFADYLATADGGYDCSHGSIIEGDSVDVLRELPENEFHAIVCDPPYNFDGGFMQQEWDNIGSAKEYQQWCQDWAERALTTLKPGGHLIAFSGNRSHHRLMSGVEDAGYEIRDTITWHYGGGFPKGSQIDRWLDDEYVEQFGDWRGMLKPSTEFAVLARAPLDGSSSTRNQMKHGTGNLNVEACRIEGSKPKRVITTEENADSLNYGEDTFQETSGMAKGTSDEGRFPPNLALDAVMADVMDLLAGDVSGVDNRGQCDGERDSGFYDVGSDAGDDEPNSRVYADDGGASRFFYCSKAAKAERTHDGKVENDHPTVKPIDLMEWLVKMVTDKGQKVLDPFAGSGTTMIAAENVGRECVGIEMDEDYIEIAEERWKAHTAES